MIVRVLSLVQDVLVAHKVWLLIGHPVTPSYTDGVAAVEVSKGVSTVAIALIVAALEVVAFVKDNLSRKWMNIQNVLDTGLISTHVTFIYKKVVERMGVWV